MTLALSVTDDQLGRYFRRMVAIVERGGKSLPFDKLMDMLQTVHDGKLTPFTGGLRGRFVPTMPLLIGGVPKLELIEQAKQIRTLSTYAESMIRHNAFTTLADQELALQIQLLVEDLGFTEEPTTDELFDENRLLAWSEANLEGYRIELNRAEAGPHMAIQYVHQPKGEAVYIAMEPTPGADGDPYVFVVGRCDDGMRWLNGDWALPHDRWYLGRRLSFRLRKLS